MLWIDPWAYVSIRVDCGSMCIMFILLGRYTIEMEIPAKSLDSEDYESYDGSDLASHVHSYIVKW